jgi:hypothetical protein
MGVERIFMSDEQINAKPGRPVDYGRRRHEGDRNTRDFGAFIAGQQSVDRPFRFARRQPERIQNVPNRNRNAAGPPAFRHAVHSFQKVHLYPFVPFSAIPSK